MEFWSEKVDGFTYFRPVMEDRQVWQLVFSFPHFEGCGGKRSQVLFLSMENSNNGMEGWIFFSKSFLKQIYAKSMCLFKTKYLLPKSQVVTKFNVTKTRLHCRWIGPLERSRESVKYIYRISANSFRGNYSFLNLALCTVTFGNST